MSGKPLWGKTNLKGNLLLRENHYGVMILDGKKWWEGCGRDVGGI